MKVQIELVAVVGGRRILLSSTDLVVNVNATAKAIPKEDHPELTKRETQVRDLIMEGKAHKEIADALNISVRTVKHHATSVYKKYGVTGSRDLVLKLAGMGIGS